MFMRQFFFTESFITLINAKAHQDRNIKIKVRKLNSHYEYLSHYYSFLTLHDGCAFLTISVSE